MNVKVHTPKSLMKGSGMATVKQFILSLVATTISIVLTFGTAAWIEGQKKEEAKHEMVMMILYDLSGAIEHAETIDSLLREGFEKQVAIAANPKLLEQNSFPFVSITNGLRYEYTETVERIFSSNIETINTLGNVLFAENVSEIYQARKNFKEEVCDSFIKNFDMPQGTTEYVQIMNLEFNFYIPVSGMIIKEMRDKFAQCMQMMDVSDSALETYRRKREKMVHTLASDSIRDILLEECVENYNRLKEAKEKGKELMEKNSPSVSRQ